MKVQKIKNLKKNNFPRLFDSAFGNAKAFIHMCCDLNVFVCLESEIGRENRDQQD